MALGNDCAWYDLPCRAGSAIATAVMSQPSGRAAYQQVTAAPDIAVKTAVDAAAATLGVSPAPNVSSYAMPTAAPGGATGPGGATRACVTESPRSGGTSYWRGVQQRLCDRGFDPGRIDGRVGPNTRGGVEAFQRSNGIPVSGRVDAATAGALGVSQEPTRAAAGAGASRGGAAPEGEGPETPSGISQLFDFRSPIFWGGLLVVGGLGIAGFMVLRKRQRAKFMATPLGPERQLPPATSAPAAATANAGKVTVPFGRERGVKDKVIFRRWKDTGEIIALFPEVPSSYSGNDFETYMHVGQHGAGTEQAIIPRTTSPHPFHPDVQRLKRELEQIGYDLDVKQRISDAMRRRRRHEASAYLLPEM